MGKSKHIVKVMFPDAESKRRLETQLGEMAIGFGCVDIPDINKSKQGYYEFGDKESKKRFTNQVEQVYSDNIKGVY